MSIFPRLVMIAFLATPASASQGGDDPALARLMAAVNRFGDQTVHTRVELVIEEPSGKTETSRLEVWKQGVAGAQSLAVLLLAPAEERGMALHIQEGVTGREGHTVRHLYLPGLDRVTEVRGLRRSRLEDRLNQFASPTLLEFGPGSTAATLGFETIAGVRCRHLSARSRSGETFEIWLDESANPVVRKALRLDSRNRPVQILTIHSYLTISGKRTEAEGTVEIPGKSVARFRLLEGRVVGGGPENPAGLDALVARARSLAAQDGPSGTR